jgi:hypothetical protein
MFCSPFHSAVLHIVLIALLLHLDSFALDIDGLKSSSLKEREKTVAAIRQERDAAISQLLQLASQKIEPSFRTSTPFQEYPWKDSKHLAILLLGDFRATEAVAVLIDNMEYYNPESKTASLQMRDSSFPAVGALIKIGMPAVDPVVRKLGSYEKECLGRDNCLWILKYILGDKLLRAELEIAIDEANTPEAKANLKQALAQWKRTQKYKR